MNTRHKKEKKKKKQEKIYSQGDTSVDSSKLHISKYVVQRENSNKLNNVKRTIHYETTIYMTENLKETLESKRQEERF